MEDKVEWQNHDGLHQQEFMTSFWNLLNLGKPKLGPTQSWVSATTWERI